MRFVRRNLIHLSAAIFSLVVSFYGHSAFAIILRGYAPAQSEVVEGLVYQIESIRVVNTKNLEESLAAVLTGVLPNDSNAQIWINQKPVQLRSRRFRYLWSISDSQDLVVQVRINEVSRKEELQIDLGAYRGDVPPEQLTRKSKNPRQDVDTTKAQRRRLWLQLGAGFADYSTTDSQTGSTADFETYGWPILGGGAEIGLSPQWAISLSARRNSYLTKRDPTQLSAPSRLNSDTFFVGGDWMPEQWRSNVLRNPVRFGLMLGAKYLNASYIIPQSQQAAEVRAITSLSAVIGGKLDNRFSISENEFALQGRAAIAPYGVGLSNSNIERMMLLTAGFCLEWLHSRRWSFGFEADYSSQRIDVQNKNDLEGNLSIHAWESSLIVFYNF